MNTHAVLLQGIAILIQCVIVLMSTVSDSWDAAVTLSQLYLLAQSIAFIAIIMDNRRGGISYMIEFFLLFFIALPALLQISKRVFPWFAMLQPIHICGAFGVLALSHLALHVGLILNEQKIKRRALTLSPNKDLNINVARNYSKSAWLFAVMAIVLAIMAGPSNLFVARFEVSEVELKGMSQQFLFMCRSLSLLAMIILLFLVKNSPFQGVKRQNIYAIILFLPFFLAINYLPALPRFILFGIIIALSTAFIDYFIPKIKFMVALVSVFILFIVFPTIKSLGRGEFDSGAFEQRIGSGAITEYLLRVDFDGFMQIASTIEYYVNSIGPIRYGENFLGVILFFIPRAIWPNKPIDTGEIISTGLGYTYTNVSSPLPAEALMGFGILGPALIFFMLALFVSKVEYKAKLTNRSSTSFSSIVLYAITMGFIVIILRGALNGVAPQFATAFLAFFVAMLFSNKNFVIRRK